MRIPPEAVLTLLHTCTFGTLATHSVQVPGFPYATVLPYVLDSQHRPLLCISALAEHTKNVLADPRVSLSVVQPGAEDVQDVARLTLVATIERIEPDPALLARYLRYQPKTAELLALDFMFFRLQPLRVRYIGGVGRMGWLSDREWAELPALPGDVEENFLRETSAVIGGRVRILSADCFGIDYEIRGQRHRQCFPDAPLTVQRFAVAAPRIVAELS